MPRTQPTGKQIKDGSVQRDDLDASTVGQAVVRKLIEGAGITLTATGADAGTGDVTVAASVPAGPPGPAGSAGLPYLFSSSTSSSNPGSGYLRFNNATLASVTAIYIHGTDVDFNSRSAQIAAWDDSTSALKGYLAVIDPAGALAVFAVTGALTDNGAWYSIPVARASGALTVFTDDQVELAFSRTGDKGDAASPTFPQNIQSANYTTVLADLGKHILHPTSDTTARTFTLAANTNVSYPLGTRMFFVNQHGAGTVTLAIATDTIYWAGKGVVSFLNILANGIAKLIKVTTIEWMVEGFNLVFTPRTNTYNAASGNEVVPTGAAQLIVEAVGGGGGGGNQGMGTQGGGGGGGGYSRKTLAISPADWGLNIAYAVGAAAGNSTVGNVVLGAGTINLAANGGGNAVVASPGAGGTATGGDTNTSGVSGTAGVAGIAGPGGAGAAPLGGAGGAAGTDGVAPGGGGGASSGGGPGGNGAAGTVIFAWT